MSKKSRIKGSFKAADELAALDSPPLIDEELEAEIRAARERTKNMAEEEIEKEFEEAHSRKPKEK